MNDFAQRLLLLNVFVFVFDCHLPAAHAKHSAQFFYDVAGRLDHTLDALSRKTQHGYDDAGRVLSLKIRRDKTFSFGYGAVDGLPTTFSYPGGRQSQTERRANTRS